MTKEANKRPRQRTGEINKTKDPKKDQAKDQDKIADQEKRP